jgi:hypothetical protein
MAGYWVFHNVFRRLIGLWFVTLGSLAVIVVAVWLIWPQLDTTTHVTIAEKVAGIGAFSLAIVWGVFLLRLPTYRPDLGDKPWLMSSAWAEQLPSRRDRNWWTGSPKKGIQSAERFGSDGAAV